MLVNTLLAKFHAVLLLERGGSHDMTTGALCKCSYLLTQRHSASWARCPSKLISIDIDSATSSADQESCTDPSLLCCRPHSLRC